MGSSSSPCSSSSIPHSPFSDHSHKPTPFSRTHLLLFPPPSSPTPTPTFACHSTPTSLSDQLLPLSSVALLDPNERTPETQTLLLSTKPKSTWVNPSRPRPKVLSLRRQRRPSLPYNPNLTDLPLLSRRLAAVPDDDPEAFSAAMSETLPNPPTRETSLLILNTLRPWNKAHQFFLWLKDRNFFDFGRDAILYNVAMKNLRFGKRFDLVETLAEEMVESGVELDNITYSTIITSAKRCRRFDRAVYWFDRMYKTGLMPDEVTYSAILDVYAKLGKVEEVLSLYERGRASGWSPDAVAFSVLGKMFGEAGDSDGVYYVLGEMKSVGIPPNLVVYNTLIDAIGKAGKPGIARSLFDEMCEKGLTPNEKTLTSLIKIYGKARWNRDAMDLWERMRSNNWPMDHILYNTLLSMCADLGLEEDGERLFADMKRGSKPDSWSYTAMVNIYASGGKVEKALGVFEEMVENRIEPNVMSCTCLIQCFGRAGRIDEAVKVFAVLIEKAIAPDDRLCGCLLSVIAVCENRDDFDKVVGCVETFNPRIVRFIRMMDDEDVGYDKVKEEFKGVISNTKVEARRPFCNCLIDICLNKSFNFPSRRAQELFSLGTLYGLYPGLLTKYPREWSLNLRSLSVGAACTGFEEWMATLARCVESEEALPQVFTVTTGTGSHKLAQGLATSFASHLLKLGSPFRQEEEKTGHFVAHKDDVVFWIQNRAPMSTATT